MAKPNVREPAFPADWSLIDFVIRGARVEVAPVNGFMSYESILEVAEADGDLLLSEDAMEFIKQTGDRVRSGYLPLGRFHEPRAGSTEYTWSSIHGDSTVMNEAAQAYRSLIANVGRWPDLATMFRSRYGHDPLSDAPERQPSMRWFWLAAQLGHPGSQPVNFLEEQGLYIDPDARLIPVFSNRLDAVRMAKPLSVKGVSLQVHDVPCLGCYLTGVAGDLGRERVRGALIDGQWKVQMFTCAEHGNNKPSHLVIDDGMAQYDLIGCAERGWPRWADRRWRGSVYEVPCDLKPW